jgi:hypothetical protein
VLASGRLPAPDAELAGLLPSGAPAAGGTGEAHGFALREPVGTRVLTERPALAWSPAPEAARYVVVVRSGGTIRAAGVLTLETSGKWEVRAMEPHSLDPADPGSGRTLAITHAASGTTWQAPLARGETYTWSVAAYCHAPDGGFAELAQAPGAGEPARFGVAPKNAAAAMERQLRAYAASPLLQVVRLAREGFLADAEQRLAGYLKDHPADERARQIQTALWRLRQGGSGG